MVYLRERRKSVLIVLREHHAKHGVDDAEHRCVGQHLDEVTGSGGQREEHPRRQEDEEEHGDKYVKVHLYVVV